ncbi:two-component system, NtrC family, nitrogen regulation sensor histidine kinase NtrY [Desulfosarcina sp. BuS5]|nr:two-component system, NtrC family, nitrogen regulation sensor histidine kinase NtrY [Desulfosarcina sp. BuS5]
MRPLQKGAFCKGLNIISAIIMKITRSKIKKPVISDEERKRRKREFVLIIIIITIVALLTYVENRIIHFGVDFPISNTILMFILININLLLLILLIFLVFRNLVKLIYDRKSKVMGAKLRTRLVVAFISLTLLPTIVLFFFSINFITTSIEFWFNVPIEQSLENSLNVGRHLYKHIEENNRFFLKRISYQIKKRNLLKPPLKKALSNYIEVVQKSFNFQAVEVYKKNFNRITYSIGDELNGLEITEISGNNLQKYIDSEEISSFSEIIDTGELIRTIGRVPFGSNLKDVQGYIVVAILIPPALAENMSYISRGVEEYRQIKLLKKPVQITYYIALSIVALLVVFCAVWFGFYMAKSITIPIMDLAEGTRRVAEGDLSFTIALFADDEIGSLVDSFNKMTRDLRMSREQLEFSASKLREQNLEIEKRRQFMEIVLKNISAGVITLGAGGLISSINKSAEKMLNIQSEEIISKSYKELLKEAEQNHSVNIIEKIADPRGDSIEFPLRLTINGRPRSFMVHVYAIKSDAGIHMGKVMVFDDLTELEKAQRMMAWREVARRIAHEVKNPLTPIALSAQRLKRRYADKIDEPVFEECVTMIVDNVAMIKNLVNEFSIFARFPTANPAICEFQPIIEETISLYREGHEYIDFKINIFDDIPKLNLDRQQIKQAMINLVDNAVAAVRGKGEIRITLTYDPILKMVRLEVADNGNGISDEEKTRLFEPYFSTKKAGIGLGLTIVSTIISDHNGMIRVQDNHPRGAKFVIELPA